MLEATSQTKAQTKAQKKPFLLIVCMLISHTCVGFFLSGCTMDSVPDEEFEAPRGNFPLLGEVPGRPLFQPQEDIVRQQRRLQHEHREAREKQAGIIQSIAS